MSEVRSWGFEEPEHEEEESDSAAGGDDGKAETYEKAVAGFQTEEGGKLSKAKAMIRAAKELPKSHEAWKAGQTPVAGS